MGVPPKALAADSKRLMAAMTSQQQKADAMKEVTVDMVKEKAGVDACNKVVRKALHNEGVYFYRLKEKPTLEDADVRSRYDWAPPHGT